MSYQNFNNRPQPDQVLVEIANYAASYTIQSDLAYEIARYFDGSLGGLEALSYPACTKLLGRLFPVLWYQMAHWFQVRHFSLIQYRWLLILEQ